MIISATRISRSRAWRECCQCGKPISLGAECVSIYGAADRHDKPFRMWSHEPCLGGDMREALYRADFRRIAGCE